MEYKPTTAEHNEMIAFTQKIADLLHEAATSDNAFLSWYKSPFYSGLQAALKASIKDTYPDVDVDKVRDLIIDNGESVQYNVGYWRTQQAAHTWCTITWPGGDGGAYCEDHQVNVSY